MARYIAIGTAVLCLASCATEPARDIEDQPIMTQQGTEMDGLVLQGAQLQGKFIRGFRFSGATLNGAPLVNFRLEKGELVAQQNSVTLRGTALADAHLFADAENRTGPPQTVSVEYRIAAITAEVAGYDPTQTGNTYLYTLEQRIGNTSSWQLACPADGDGRRAAIPLADTFNQQGNRNSAAPWFTLGCTTGAVAKCYRLGYRPWVNGYGNLMIMHWTCTRVVRADYCGDGFSHTQNGKLINAWDVLAPPGPVLAKGATPQGMTFEAAWHQNGAICLSHARWAADGEDATAACPNRLRPPDGSQPGNTCDNQAEALMQSNGAPRMFNESVIPP